MPRGREGGGVGADLLSGGDPDRQDRGQIDVHHPVQRLGHFPVGSGDDSGQGASGVGGVNVSIRSAIHTRATHLAHIQVLRTDLAPRTEGAHGNGWDKTRRVLAVQEIFPGPGICLVIRCDIGITRNRRDPESRLSGSRPNSTCVPSQHLPPKPFPFGSGRDRGKFPSLGPSHGTTRILGGTSRLRSGPYPYTGALHTPVATSPGVSRPSDIPVSRKGHFLHFGNALCGAPQHLLLADPDRETSTDAGLCPSGFNRDPIHRTSSG